MALTRGTALVANVAAVVALTGQQDLANLEADGEVTLTDLLTTASDAIYDQIEATGVDPTLITNPTRFERAVAWHFLALLALRGYLPIPRGMTPPVDDKGRPSAYGWSDAYFERVRATLSTGDEARRPDEGVPSFVNFEAGVQYAGGTTPNSDQLKTWIPQRRER